MSAGAFWAAAAAGAVASLVVGELVDVSAWIAPKIIRSASARMPTPDLQERYREEWLAELSAFDGLKLVKLVKAISLWVTNRSVLCGTSQRHSRYVRTIPNAGGRASRDARRARAAAGLSRETGIEQDLAGRKSAPC
jgi:hypothetical protein